MKKEVEYEKVVRYDNVDWDEVKLVIILVIIYSLVSLFDFLNNTYVAIIGVGIAWIFLTIVYLLQNRKVTWRKVK